MGRGLLSGYADAVSSLFAFLYHVAAFTLVSVLSVELVLIGGEMSVQRARQLRFADLAYGAAAGIVLVIGLLRVFFFEKGASYYLCAALMARGVWYIA